MRFKNGAKRESNPRPLAPEARIIPLDHWPAPVAHGQKVTSGFEPLTTGSAILCSATELRNHSIEKESRQPDSNRRPLPYEGSAMTAMLCRQVLVRKPRRSAERVSGKLAAEKYKSTFGGARTRDHRIKSPALYRLSYESMLGPNGNRTHVARIKT